MLVFICLPCTKIDLIPTLQWHIFINSASARSDKDGGEGGGGAL